jgi:hemolysin activation/secretion protein
VEYLPLNFQYDASLRDALGLNSFTLGLGVNAWYSGPVTNLQNITGSSKSSGHWVVINPSYSRNLELVPNWVTLFRADGQWASEPLISNEKFGAGGVNSVRGYREGQVFGDTGWHVSLEQQTPPHLAGYVRGNIPLTIRGSIYMDFAETYLLAPQGSPASTALWGTGFGGVASLGSQFEARFLFSLPLLSTSTSAAYAPFFNFSLMAQF